MLKKASVIIADSRRDLKALSNIALFTDFGGILFTNFTPVKASVHWLSLCVSQSGRSVSLIAHVLETNLFSYTSRQP